MKKFLAIQILTLNWKEKSEFHKKAYYRLLTQENESIKNSLSTKVTLIGKFRTEDKDYTYETHLSFWLLAEFMNLL